MQLKIRKVKPNAMVPASSYQSAGLDLFAAETAYIPGKGFVTIGTGIAAEFPAEYVALIWDRSGLASKGLHRFAGVIDSDYRGEWKVVIYNADKFPHWVRAGDGIAQVLFQARVIPEVMVVHELSCTERGERGFGSSDSEDFA